MKIIANTWPDSLFAVFGTAAREEAEQKPAAVWNGPGPECSF